MARFPKIPFGDPRAPKLPPKQPPKPQAIDPAMQKKRQEIIVKIQQKIIDIERCLNHAEYKKAFQIATGELAKYTPGSIGGNDLLARLASLAETAIDYMHGLTSPEDDAFLELLGGQMEEYKDIALYKAIERMMAERLGAKLAQLVGKGKTSWARTWLETWKPWVLPADGERAIEKLVKEPAEKTRWKFIIPPAFSPGEKQRAVELRRKISHAMVKLEEGIDEGEIDAAAGRVPDAQVAETPPLPVVLPVEIPKTRPSASSSGVFSRKKALVEGKQDAEKDTPKKPKHKRPGPSRALPAPTDEPAFSSADVRERLQKYKHEEGLKEFHFMKLKTDLGVVSLNQEKKLFKILERLILKGYVIRKKGNVYAILA